MTVPNMCFEKDPQEIADILNGFSGIKQDDILTGLIGLARIVSDHQVKLRYHSEIIATMEAQYRAIERMRNYYGKNVQEADRKMSINAVQNAYVETIGHYGENGITSAAAATFIDKLKEFGFVLKLEGEK